MEHISTILARVILDIKHPSLEECYQSGYKALSLDDNPHKIGSANYCHWNNGYWDRQFSLEDIGYQAIPANDEVCDPALSEISRKIV